MRSAVATFTAVLAALAAPPSLAQTSAARNAEPVVLTGAKLPAWSGPAATAVCTAGLPGDRDAHHGTYVAPPATGVPVNEIAAYRWDGTRFQEIPVQVDQLYPYCLANGKPANCHVCRTSAESAAGSCDVDCALGQTQGAYGSHGVHYFVTSDTDNAEAPSTLNEIDAQQWQFAVPTAAPTNVGDPYGNVVKVPLQTLVAPLEP